MLDILVVFVITALVVYYISSRKHPAKFPPGPRAPIPVLGDAYVLGQDFVEAFHKLRVKYGDVVGMWIGPTRGVALCKYEDIQELLQKAESSNRQYVEVVPLCRRGISVGPSAPGVLFASNKTWSDIRRFSLHTLRDFGFGKQGLEDVVEEEVSDLGEFIDTHYANKPVDVKDFFNLAAVASLWRVVSGERIRKDDSKLKYLVHMVQSLSKEQTNPFVVVSMDAPWLCKIFHHLGLVKTVTAHHDLLEMGDKMIKDHQDKGIDDQALDYTEAFLKKIQETKDPMDPFYGQMGLNNLSNVLADFFMAGSDTTANALNWGMLFMLIHQDIQAKVHAELDETVGQSGKISMKDKERTPYTEAVLHEVTRRGNILPMSVWHCSVQDRSTEVAGHVIPPGTVIIPLIGEVMMDPKNFDHPEQFNPERYLTRDNGKLKFTPHPKVIPFGVGKRRCLGEVLARTQLYKFFTGIMQRYTIESGQSEPITADAGPGYTHAPLPYKLVFKPRRA